MLSFRFWRRVRSVLLVQIRQECVARIIWSTPCISSWQTQRVVYRLSAVLAITWPLTSVVSLLMARHWRSLWRNMSSDGEEICDMMWLCGLWWAESLLKDACSLQFHWAIHSYLFNFHAAAFMVLSSAEHSGAMCAALSGLFRSNLPDSTRHLSGALI